jgi:nitrogen fixation protein FixH
MSNMLLGMEGKAGATPSQGRALTGRMVLAIVVCFFATVGGVNAVMMRLAMTTFRGEVVDHPYEAGLVFNSDIAAARAQAARHWTVEARFDTGVEPRRIHVMARDAEGRPITGLKMIAEFLAPVNNRVDRRIRLEEREGGLYEAEASVSPGAWDFDIVAAREAETLFRSRSRVRLD